MYILRLCAKILSSKVGVAVYALRTDKNRMSNICKFIFKIYVIVLYFGRSLVFYHSVKTSIIHHRYETNKSSSTCIFMVT